MTRVQRSEAGFTLAELLVAITVVGIVMPVLVTTFISGFRTTTGTTDRLAASNDAQFTSSWFIPDVQSADSFSAVDVPTCLAPSGSTRLFTLTRAAGTAAVVTGYAIVPGTPRTLVRYSCTNGTPDPIVTVGHNLASTDPTVSCTPSPCGPTTDHVSVTVWANDANGTSFKYALNAERRTS